MTPSAIRRMRRNINQMSADTFDSLCNMQMGTTAGDLITAAMCCSGMRHWSYFYSEWC